MIHWKVYARQHPRYGVWYQRIERQPPWVVKAALALAVVFVVLPLVLLTLAAATVGLVAFVVLGAIAAVVGSVARLFMPRPGDLTPRDDGRRNVRVLRD